MQTFLITANDTDAGKTHVTGLLARYFANRGQRVQVVKAVDCGGSGDAARAAAVAGTELVSAHTLYRFNQPMAPLAAANRHGSEELSLTGIVEAIRRLPETDIRLIEGAGGVAVPIDPRQLDWRDLARAIPGIIVLGVVDNRLGSINQSRLLSAYLGDLPHWVILNEQKPCPVAISESNQAALAESGIALAAVVGYGDDQLTFIDEAVLAGGGGASSAGLPAGGSVSDVNRREQLEQRKAGQCLRQTLARGADDGSLNLADNDYLSLSRHPEVVRAVRDAVDIWGASSSASPLISGYTEEHRALEQDLSGWYGGRSALLWNSGFAANQATLQCFVSRGDWVLADRLIHHSLIKGTLQSGARLTRFRHNDLGHLEQLLQSSDGSRRIHVVTESVYSMDGDAPDLRKLAELKQQYGFQWFLDEAHAVGWYGTNGAGLAQACGVGDSVDILCGTLGKALGSVGAYTVFRQPWMRDYCVNEAGEFIYSTYLPPASAAAARAAIGLVRQWGDERRLWHERAGAFRHQLRAAGWTVAGVDSPVVAILTGTAERALAAAAAMAAAGIRVAAVRPPTVPKGQARLRISLKSTLRPGDYGELLDCIAGIRSE